MKLSNFAVDSRRTFSEKETLDVREDTLELEDLLKGFPRFISDITSDRKGYYTLQISLIVTSDKQCGKSQTNNFQNIWPLNRVK